MKPLPNSPRSSMQRLRGVLQQALLDGFQSHLKDKSKIALSEEIVNAILFEIEGWLVEFSSETIDQVAGRLESKIAEIEKNLGNLDEDEPLSVQDETIESIRNELEGGNEADKSFTDAICKVLGGINKDSKLKKFKKYLEKTAKPYKKQKQKEQDEQDGSEDNAAAKQIKKSLKRGDADFFFERCFKPDILDALDKAIFGDSLRMQEKIEKTLTGIEKKTELAKSSYSRLIRSDRLLTLSNLRLAKIRLRLSLVNTLLAVSNITLAAANVVLAVAIFLTAVATMIFVLAHIWWIASLVILTAVVLAAYLMISIAIALAVLIASVVLIGGIALIAVFILAVAAAVVFSLITAFLALAIVVTGVVAALVIAGLGVMLFAVSMFAAVLILSAAAVVAAAIPAAAILIGAAILGTAMLLGMSFVGAAIVALVTAEYMVAHALFRMAEIILVSFSILAAAIVLAGLITVTVARMAIASVKIAITGIFAVITALIASIALFSGIFFLSVFVIAASIFAIASSTGDVLKDWWDSYGSGYWKSLVAFWDRIKGIIANVFGQWFNTDELNSRKSVWDRITAAMDEIEEKGFGRWLDEKLRAQPPDSVIGKIIKYIDEIPQVEGQNPLIQSLSESKQMIEENKENVYNTKKGVINITSGSENLVKMIDDWIEISRGASKGILEDLTTNAAHIGDATYWVMNKITGQNIERKSEKEKYEEELFNKEQKFWEKLRSKRAVEEDNRLRKKKIEDTWQKLSQQYELNTLGLHPSDAVKFMEEVSDGEKLDEDSALKKLGFDRKDPNAEKILEKIRKQHEYYRVIYAEANAAVKTKNKGATSVEAVVKGLEDAGAPRLVDKK